VASKTGADGDQAAFVVGDPVDTIFLEQGATITNHRPQYVNSMADVFTVFLETHSRLESMFRAGVTSKQIVAAIVDNVSNQCPPAIADALVAALTKPMDSLMGDLLTDLMISAFVPPPSLGQVGPNLENVPSASLSPAVPIGQPQPLGDPDAAPSPHASTTAPISETKGPVGGAGPIDMGLPEGISGQIKRRIGTKIADAMIEKDLPHAANLLHSTMTTGVNTLTERQMSRSVTRGVVEEATGSVSRGLIKQFLAEFAKSFTRLPTKELTRYLTPTLTHSLAMTITHTLTRSPQSDYLCWYCRTRELYCENCKSVMTKDYYTDFYVHYYAHHYSVYMAGQFWSKYADYFVDNYHSDNPFVPEPGPNGERGPAADSVSEATNQGGEENPAAQRDQVNPPAIRPFNPNSPNT